MRFMLTLAQSAQTCRNKLKNLNEVTENSFQGHFFEKMPPRRISNQNIQLNNFSPVQPILTSNKPIDSARQAEIHGNIKHSPNFILGGNRGNFHKKYPLE